MAPFRVGLLVGQALKNSRLLAAYAQLDPLIAQLLWPEIDDHSRYHRRS